MSAGYGETTHTAVIVDACEPVVSVCVGEGCHGEQQREENLVHGGEMLLWWGVVMVGCCYGEVLLW